MDIDVDGFQKVSYKRSNISKSRRRPNKSVQIHCDTKPSLDSPFEEEYSIRKICGAKTEILSSDLFKSLVASLREELVALNNSAISEIVCLGLGRIGECVTSRYQFALILCLKEIFDGTLSAYDPIFTLNDIKLLNHFKVTVLTENLEGKYKTDGNQVLFYLPHCPKQLTNNLLWANWSQNLSSCIIIANSFNKIIENCSIKTLKASAEYILKVIPHVLEIPIINNFKYNDIFNDLAVHVFPNLNLVSQDLWNEHSEPRYIEEDIEFIIKNCEEALA